MSAGTVTAKARLERYRSDPVAFAREVLGVHLWSKQRDTVESVRDHPRTAVRSCHGAGKTKAASVVIHWFLTVFPRSRVISTAPTHAQLQHVLWREIGADYRASKGFIGGELFDTRLELAEDWFAIGLSTDRADRFQGHHAEHLLFVADEAPGVPEEIFEAAAGFLTSPEARVLLIGNPTKTSGEFFDAFHSQRALYNTISIPASSTPSFTGERVPRDVRRKIVSKRWVEDHEKKWGVGSPLWQIRIGAEFPSQGDDSVCALGDLEQAREQTLEEGWPLVIGCDVARFGSDQTVIAVRRGNVVKIAKAYGGRDTMQTVGALVSFARELHGEYDRKPTIVVDDAGVGGGVTDRLREQDEFRVVPFLGAGKARDQREYPNRRSESWFDFSDLLPDLDLPADDEELAADLLAPKYVIDSAGRRVVEPKSDTKKRLRHSPDRADAVVMACSIDRPRRMIRMTSHVARQRIGRSPESIERAFARDRRGRATPRIASRTSGRGDALDDISARTGIPIY